MTGKETLNLIRWLRKEGMDEKKIVECIEFVEGHEPEKDAVNANAGKD